MLIKVTVVHRIWSFPGLVRKVHGDTAGVVLDVAVAIFNFICCVIYLITIGMHALVIFSATLQSHYAITLVHHVTALAAGMVLDIAVATFNFICCCVIYLITIGMHADSAMPLCNLKMQLRHYPMPLCHTTYQTSLSSIVGTVLLCPFALSLCNALFRTASA